MTSPSPATKRLPFLSPTIDVPVHPIALAAPAARERGSERARAAGKWLWLGAQRYLPRGVTYGPFRCATGSGLPARDVAQRDFAAMAAAGVDSLRTYTVPPVWFLDDALAHGLRVLV